MPDFLTKSLCRGHRPQHLAVRRHIPRPDLIAKLLRERHVPRFVVAPDGFGKSAVAAEYAETVFRFERVFWIDAKSPCFLRDLDAGRIASTLSAKEEAPFLAVIEDVPALDPERVERLSGEMDRMLERGCEVLVTCVPARDAFHRHLDRVKLGSADLLLSDAEVDVLRTAAERESDPASRAPAARRVAALAWGGAEERISFLEAAACEELPADLLLSLFVMMVLEEGTLEDLDPFVPLDGESVALLAEQYPYLGIDRQSGRFRAPAFSVGELADAFGGRLGAMAQRSSFPDGDALAVRAADALAARGKPARACDAARLLAGRAARAEWLAERGFQLADSACLVPACEVYASLNGERGAGAALLEATEACRRALLGSRLAACEAARRAAGAHAAPASARAAGVVVLACCAEGAERARALKLAPSIAAALDQEGPERFGVPGVDRRSFEAAMEVRRALDASCAEAARVWLGRHDGGACGRAGTQSAAWILAMAEAPPRGREGGPSAAGRGAGRAVDEVAAIVRDRVRGAGGESLGLFDAVAGMSLERACARGAVSTPALDEPSARSVRRLEMALRSQRSEYERKGRERAAHRRALAVANPDVFAYEGAGLDPTAPRQTDPVLTVNLFGGLDVRIGGERVDASLFRRQKVKTLLALLVLNRGREFSRDKLVSLLWPDSDLMAARKNFYGIWSMLRRALRTPAGTCPYLIRQQHGLRVDANLLSSDVLQLDEVCNALLFERPDYGGWAHLFAQINDRFSDEILPSESDNDAIAGRRAECRDRLVDALVAASKRLVGAGEVREGLWFARAALQRDKTREDVYVTLMEAQLGAGQRTAALETYFSCRRFLADELGIDPSMDTMRLYRGIIDSEEILD